MNFSQFLLVVAASLFLFGALEAAGFVTLGTPIVWALLGFAAWALSGAVHP